jgi:Arc/MetJ family transcription regulator
MLGSGRGSRRPARLCLTCAGDLLVRTTVVIDDELFATAQECTGLPEKSAVIREALTALVQREAGRRLARMGGTARDAKAPPR